MAMKLVRGTFSLSKNPLKNESEEAYMVILSHFDSFAISNQLVSKISFFQ